MGMFGLELMDDGAHEGFSFGKRNVEDEMILEFADALNLAVLNTLFKKRRADCSHMSPAIAGLRLITSIQSRKSERKITRGITVVKVECIRQHRLLVCVFDLQEKVGQCIK